jgi:hypothetical protein
VPFLLPDPTLVEQDYTFQFSLEDKVIVSLSNKEVKGIIHGVPSQKGLPYMVKPLNSDTGVDVLLAHEDKLQPDLSTANTNMSDDHSGIIYSQLI